MRLCAYWDCMEEVDEGMSFCREHGRMLNRQLIDKCPKCGRYKDIRQKFCPDCNYGRPVADWKVASRNLDEVNEYVEPPSQAEQVNAYEQSTPELTGSGVQPPARGEAMCPSCGSSNLTYKNVFDYYRCDDCETTFITPVYSYGEAGYKPEGAAPSQPANRQNVIEAPGRQTPPPPPRRQEPRVQQPQQPQPPPVQWQAPPVQPQPAQWQEPPVQPQQWEEPAVPVQRTRRAISFGKIPNLDIMRRHDVENRLLNLKALKMQGQGGKLGWVYLVVVLCIVALLALLGWVFFNEQITSAIGTIF